MTKGLTLPDTASAQSPDAQGRLHAPSAARNSVAITTLIKSRLPHQGQALEIASGTGQHVVDFARALPDLTWQPTDVDPMRLASIDAWAEAASLTNVRPAQHLDACSAGWGATHPDQTVIVLVNLLHLITTAQAKTLISEAAEALAPGGHVLLYGPFLRDGETTSEGDAVFDASLRAQDPEIGYKDDFDVIDWLHAQWLELVDVVEMPANNLALVAKKPG